MKNLIKCAWASVGLTTFVFEYFLMRFTEFSLSINIALTVLFATCHLTVAIVLDKRYKALKKQRQDAREEAWMGNPAEYFGLVAVPSVITLGFFLLWFTEISLFPTAYAIACVYGVCVFAVQFVLHKRHKAAQK